MSAAGAARQWQVALPASAEVAERPVWDAISGSLLWVDVLAGDIHRSVPPEHKEIEGIDDPWQDHAMSVGKSVGAAALREDGGLIAAADSAFVLVDSSGRPDADPVPVDMPLGARFNDGACDPAGRFVAGTTSAAGTTGGGSLWSLAPTGHVTTLLDGVTESNGLGWSPDGRTMYYVDSGERAVRRYAYDPDNGRLGGRRRDLTLLRDDAGWPDGLVVDADGAIWLALWEGAAVRRYSPDGDLLQQVDVPVSRPTCPGFAGKALDLLVVTTAQEGMDVQQRAAEPWAGHVLVSRGEAVGCPQLRFGRRLG